MLSTKQNIEHVPCGRTFYEHNNSTTTEMHDKSKLVTDSVTESRLHECTRRHMHSPIWVTYSQTYLHLRRFIPQSFVLVVSWTGYWFLGRTYVSIAALKPLEKKIF